MKTIVISSQKGGSAKTTLTALLSVAAELAGDGPACIIDTDQQGSLTRWHERRESETPMRADIPLKDLGAALSTIATTHGARYCFIDTAPAISNESAAIIALADLVLIPVQPSPVDLWAAADTIELVKAAGKPFRFVVTKAKERATITAQTVAALSNYGRVSQNFVMDRVAYAVAMTGGNTAPEIQPKGLAAAEVDLLWREIKDAFQQNSKAVRKKAVLHG
jgi:chromosome partitioning protein